MQILSLRHRRLHALELNLDCLVQGVTCVAELPIPGTLKSGFSDSHLHLDNTCTSSRPSSQTPLQEGWQINCLWKDTARAIHPLIMLWGACWLGMRFGFQVVWEADTYVVVMSHVLLGGHSKWKHTDDPKSRDRSSGLSILVCAQQVSRSPPAPSSVQGIWLRWSDMAAGGVLYTHKAKMELNWVS